MIDPLPSLLVGIFTEKTEISLFLSPLIKFMGL